MRTLLLLLISALLAGCETLSYYNHVAAGQLKLLWGRESIDTVIASDKTSPELKRQLQTVQSLRAFAIKQLQLPDNKSYLSYQDTGRPYVVWNVFAAPELAVNPKQWCFPIAGCVSYKGFFSEAEAQQYSQQLQQQGYEVYVAGVPAYSSLGWFDDPVLNTFVYWPDWRLAALLFHELAHQQLYLKGDTTFSESFARAVEIEAVTQWLNQQGKIELTKSYLKHIAMRDEFSDGLLLLRNKLQQVYQGAGDEEYKRQQKQRLIQQYQNQIYPEFENRWHNVQYRPWVMSDLNNAKLVTISSYYQWQPAFQQLLKQQQGDWRQFYNAAAAMAKQPKEQREQLLNQLLKRDTL